MSAGTWRAKCIGPGCPECDPPRVWAPVQRKIRRRSRVNRDCDVCGEPIPKGAEYVREIGFGGGQSPWSLASCGDEDACAVRWLESHPETGI